jgi:hypothetical protein
MEKWARRAFVNSCCNQNCQGMFAKELPEVSKAQQTAHGEADNTEVALSPPKNMRKKKVRVDHFCFVFVQNSVSLVFIIHIFLMGKKRRRLNKRRRFRVFTSVYLDYPVNTPANTVDLQISNFGGMQSNSDSTRGF